MCSQWGVSREPSRLMFLWGCWRNQNAPSALTGSRWIFQAFLGSVGQPDFEERLLTVKTPDPEKRVPLSTWPLGCLLPVGSELLPLWLVCGADIKPSDIRKCLGSLFCAEFDYIQYAAFSINFIIMAIIYCVPHMFQGYLVFITTLWESSILTLKNQRGRLGRLSDLPKVPYAANTHERIPALLWPAPRWMLYGQRASWPSFPFWLSTGKFQLSCPAFFRPPGWCHWPYSRRAVWLLEVYVVVKRG